MTASESSFPTSPAWPGVPEPRTYAERHELALDGIRTIAGSADGQIPFDGMSRRWGPLGMWATDVVADLWVRPQLSRRDRSLIVVTWLACQQSDNELRAHLQAALRHGVTREEIDEALLHVAGYAGYPVTMAALRVVEDTWKEMDGVKRLPARPLPEPVGDDVRRARAAEVLATMTGGRMPTDGDEVFAVLHGALGGVGEMVAHWHFGEIWSRPEMSRRDRSLVVIAILGFLHAYGELDFHVPAGLRHGLTRTEIEEVFVQLTIYGGAPRAVSGIRHVRSIFQKIDTGGA